MNRKNFFKKSLATVITCCGAASSISAISQSVKQESNDPQKWINEFEKKMIKSSETPAWLKAKKGEKWIRDLMDNMDNLLDEETKKTLMKACGRSCYINAFGVAPSKKPSFEAAERYIQYFEKKGYDVKRKDKKVTIIYNWGRDHQNPWGLIMSDGYCMCPILENDEVKISGTFCNCSTGYIKESFERSTGRRTNVEVIDSIKRGGKDCIFKVEIIEE